MTSDEFLRLFDKLSELGERQARMEVVQENIVKDIDEIKRQDEVQNQLLADHIQGVRTANARLDNEIKIRESLEKGQTDLKSRVDELERPKKASKKLFKNIYNALIYAGAVVSVIYETGRVFHKW